LRATPDGTEQYRQRFGERFVPDFYRSSALGVSVSSIGVGTYLGECDDADDDAYRASVAHAVASGINLIDTAINYRCQRSERAVGAAIRQALADGAISRESLVVCTKGGYVPLDTDAPATRAEYQEYVQREFLDPNVFMAEELVAGGHCLAPRFLRFCIATSRQNLGLRTIDLYYLHNPEQQLASVGRETLRSRLRAAFSVLEEAVERSDIAAYGCATWNGLRAPPDAKGHLALEDLIAIATDVAGEAHHFRAVQLPINLALPEAVRTPTQLVRGTLVTPLEAAAELGITVIASASLMQARLTTGLPAAVHDLFPRCTSDAQRAIEFTRTLGGVTTALVGMRTARHVDENIGAVRA
jgi:aryl-alcohol dehydrogenase-like predicted oxidoreductase